MSLINNQGLDKSETDKENERLVNEYLENGGKIQKCKYGATTPDIENSYSWGKKKK